MRVSGRGAQLATSLDMTPQETFVGHLRRQRQRARISLEEIAAQTCIKQELLEGLENNDLAAWPRGVYARAWIRSYAAAVGLDPTDTVNDFCRLFPHGDRRAHATMQDIATIVATDSQYRDEFDHPYDRRGGGTDVPAAPPPPAWHAPITQAARALWLRLGGSAANTRVGRTTP